MREAQQCPCHLIFQAQLGDFLEIWSVAGSDEKLVPDIAIELHGFFGVWPSVDREPGLENSALEGSVHINNGQERAVQNEPRAWRIP